MDPYEAVRIITRRSMRSLPGFTKLDFDAMSGETERRRVMTQVIKKWQDEFTADQSNGSQILIDVSGIQSDRVQELMDQRDDTRIRLLE